MDAAGNVRWANLTDDLKVRARPENALKEIDELLRARAGLLPGAQRAFSAARPAGAKRATSEAAARAIALSWKDGLVNRCSDC